MIRSFAPNEYAGGGGGLELTTLPLLGKEFDETLGWGPGGGGGGGRIVADFCEALLAAASLEGGNAGAGGTGDAEVTWDGNGGGGGGE